MPPSKENFQEALQHILSASEAAGQTSVKVESGELHRHVGGYPSPDHRMPLCCQVMKDAMRSGDVILQSPPSGQGASLIIEYQLQR